jgi:DeoR/GlpR family transcriptional regulator of sugar metabolism
VSGPAEGRKSGMLGAERRLRILQLLERDRSVRVTALSRLFDVSEETIRRDLDSLAREGLVVRTHGGAITNRGTATEFSFTAREQQRPVEKTRIARAAVQTVTEGETVLLDASSTALFIARHLPNLRITVLTNSVPVLVELAKRPAVQGIATGGLLRAATLSFVGPDAVRVLREHRVDRAFLGTAGITMEEGFTDANELEAEVKRTMIACSRHVTIVADSSKFGQVAFVRFAGLREVHAIITDVAAPRDLVRRLRRAGVSVRLV